MTIAASSRVSPLDAAKSKKPPQRKSAAIPEPAAIPQSSGRKPVGILDQFKDGILDSDSEDEDPAPAQMQSQTQSGDSQDTEATVDLAERAVASLVKAAVEGATAGIRRRSSRAPKPKDFGDVEVHGWNVTKRARKS